MKKTIVIILGVLLLILIVGVWAYLFAYGTPKNGSDIFAQFGVSRDTEVTTLPENSNIDVGNLDTLGTPQALKQLTTRPVAGAAFSEDALLYVEQGTGHIYLIDLQNGSETLISGTTIPGTRNALFSPESTYVAITTIDGDVSKTLVGKIQLGNQFSGISLPDNADNITFANASGTLEYTLTDGFGTIGYSYNIPKEVGTEVFALPLRDIEVLWGNPTYVYTTPSATQVGYIYRVVKNDLLFVTNGAPGLMGFRNSTDLIVTKNNGRNVYSQRIDIDGQMALQSVPYIPEKCISGSTFTYCAVPKSELGDSSFPDDWYMGTVSFDDVLWSIDTSNNSALSLVDFKYVSGREIDVFKIGADKEGKRVYLINKNDNTLWLFDTTVSNPSM